MPDELVNVRYMVDDVENAVEFHTTHFGFILPRLAVVPREDDANGARSKRGRALWAALTGARA